MASFFWPSVQYFLIAYSTRMNSYAANLTSAYVLDKWHQTMIEQ